MRQTTLDIFNLHCLYYQCKLNVIILTMHHRSKKYNYLLMFSYNNTVVSMQYSSKLYNISRTLPYGSYRYNLTRHLVMPTLVTDRCFVNL